jgi:hypothetical protein
MIKKFRTWCSRLSDWLLLNIGVYPDDTEDK